MPFSQMGLRLLRKDDDIDSSGFHSLSTYCVLWALEACRPGFECQPHHLLAV